MAFFDFSTVSHSIDISTRKFTATAAFNSTASVCMLNVCKGEVKKKTGGIVPMQIFETKTWNLLNTLRHFFYTPFLPLHIFLFLLILNVLWQFIKHSCFQKIKNKKIVLSNKKKFLFWLSWEKWEILFVVAVAVATVIGTELPFEKKCFFFFFLSFFFVCAEMLRCSRFFSVNRGWKISFYWISLGEAEKDT